MEPDDVAEATAALYRGLPERFVAARDALVKELRREGAREAAAVVGKLRRPTVAAWLVNLLVAHQPDLPGQLGELAEQLRDAQDQLAGEDLRALGRQRHQLVAGLVAQARELARGAGRPVNAEVLGEVEATLRATLADPTVAADVLSGRITHTASVEGFGAVPVDPPPKARPLPPSGPAPPPNDRRRAAELRKAEQALEKAEAALAAAEEEHSAALAEAVRVAEVRATADERATWLRTQLQQAAADLEQAVEADAAAQQRARLAETALGAAQERVEGARARADLS